MCVIGRPLFCLYTVSTVSFHSIYVQCHNIIWQDIIAGYNSILFLLFILVIISLKFFSLFFNLCTVHSEGDQPWDFFGGNDAEAETPVLWPPHVKS